MAGLFGLDFEAQTTNPLFLGGAALLSGEGMGGAIKGMQAGTQFQAQRRKQMEEEAAKQRWDQYTQGGMGGLTDAQRELIRAAGAQQGMTLAGQALHDAPRLAMEQQRLKLAQSSDSRAAAMQQAQLQQIKMQTPDWRMANAARFGIDPNTPEGKAFVISGQYAPNSGQTDDIKEFDYAKKNGFAGSFTDWMKQKKDMGNNAAQQITWGRDAQGNWVAMQATRGGELVQSKLPGGVTPVPVPELAQQKAAATQRGEAEGKAQVNLPVVELNGRRLMAALDAVEAAIKQTPRMTGLTGNLPNFTPGARDAQAKIDQVQGQVFLQAFDALRGGGAITEAEGAKAEAAYSRLKTTAVGTQAYYEAINDLRREVTSLVELARRKAQGAGGMRTAPAPAQGGGWSIQRVQ